MTAARRLLLAALAAPVVVLAAVGGGVPLEFPADMPLELKRALFDARADAVMAKNAAAAAAAASGRLLQGPGAGPGGGGGAPSSPSSSNPRAASLLGSVGYTTVAGTDAYAPSMSFPANTIIAGPFEAGFDSMIDSLLSWLGCSPASKGYLPGGIDTQTSLEAVAAACGVALPRIASDGSFISLMWSSGVHSPPNSAGCTSPPGGLAGYAACTSPAYHFHQNFTALYSLNAAGHSAKIGMSFPSSSSITARALYGMYESTGVLPALDACGGHFGFTPDSPSTKVYHHHVQDRAPFTFGCFGPSASGELVTLAECRSYYSACGDPAHIITVTTAAKGTFSYNKWCPCYDSAGSNTNSSSYSTISAKSGAAAGAGIASAAVALAATAAAAVAGGVALL